MHTPRRWNIAATAESAASLADALKTSPLIAQMLINRGIADFAEGAKFLSPSLMHLHEPAALPNLRQAADRIAKAIRDRQKIIIYGDYDVDGITATSILWHAIRTLGGTVEFYIPHRIEEGYGLNAEALKQLCDQGAQLIVSVDCGVTAVEEAQLVTGRGVDLIITDHHEWKFSRENGTPRPLLPACHTLVHPRIESAGLPMYPNPHLCGAGVALKLAWALGLSHGGGARVSDEFRQFLVEATGLAALGTIADVVPLIGENRTLAHFGLSGLKQSKLTGIRALITSAGLTGQNIDSYDVGFKLAPRLNAAGRLGHARLAVEMLTLADAAKAAEIAAYLEQQNRARQTIERKIFFEALEQAEQLGYDKDRDRGVVLGAEGWHAGVIGIVASRFVSRFNKPTVMVALNNGHGQGSGRSIPGFHLAQALDSCAEHLLGSGGHEMAAGLRLESARFEDFRAAFCDHARSAVSDEMLVPEMRIDCLAQLRQINEALVSQVQRLGPFGTGNPRPKICLNNLELAADARRVGKNGEHLQIMVRDGSMRMKCVAFNFGQMFDALRGGVKVDIAAEPQINEFNGYRNVELEIKDVRIAP